MPPLHRAFIAEVASRTSIRGFVAAAQRGDLKDSYNRCVHWIELFRSKHLEYAANYIFKQGQKAAENPHAVGTGGTPFMPYLAKHRDETADHLLR
jgi:indoleamine 2,3-dioxygenase